MKLALTCVLLTAILYSASSAQGFKDPDGRWIRRSQQPDLTASQRRACEQIARIRQLQGDAMMAMTGPDNPLAALSKMNIEILPVLAEALSDKTPTGVYRTSSKLPRPTDPKPKPVAVNEFAVDLISMIARHTFVIHQGPNDDQTIFVVRQGEAIPEFQKVVRDWYSQNRNKSLNQRKMDDLNDSFFRNRFDAADWFTKNPDRSARSSMEVRIDSMLADSEINTLLDEELALFARALGSTQDSAALPKVRKVIDRLVGYTRQGQNLTQYFADYILPEKLFIAFEGLARLGQKKQATKELRDIQARYGTKLKGYEKMQFEKHMAETAKW